ncbi:MAG TPA: DUF3592 domain-containing protein [Pyrinomonadaceae bacterium]|jgi:hypothetical protein|nr:DUF3592 domain-containing protein [Pyrinomonadaceae bacterium]
MLKHLAILSLILVVLFGTTYAIWYFAFPLDHLDYLANHGIAIYGWVVKKDPENHAAVTYSYVVDNVRYSGTGGSGRGNPRFDQLQQGDQVVVFYDPNNPADSFLGYPQYQTDLDRSFAKMAAGMIAVFMFIPIAGVYIGILQAIKSKKSKLGQANSSE